jgi:glycosyltransferase involved in cell wall biosynthesis
VRSSVRDFAPTLVHSATEFGVGLAGRRIARDLGVPFVSSYHTSFTAYARYYRLGLLARPGWHYLRWFHNGGLRTYCPTRAIVREVEAEGFRDCAVWSRGVDASRFAPQWRDAALRAAMGADDDTVVIGYVGRLAAEKGLGPALEAIGRVAAARPGKVAFAFVGDGPFEEAVRARVPEPRYLPGALHGDALSRAYASCDVFLFPSATDTFGNVLLEAMASGLPVVGVDSGPTRELVGDDRGWIAPPDDAAALAELLVRVVDDAAGRRARRAAALTFAAERTWDRVWDALVADYLALHRAGGRAGEDAEEAAGADAASEVPSNAPSDAGRRAGGAGDVQTPSPDVRHVTAREARSRELPAA